VPRSIIGIGFGSLERTFPEDLTLGDVSASASAASPTSVDLSTTGEGVVGGTAPFSTQWERSTTSASAGFSDLSGADEEQYTDTTASAGTTYWYRARITDATGDYVRTSAVEVTTPAAGAEITEATATKDDDLNTATITFSVGSGTESVSVEVYINSVLDDTITVDVDPDGEDYDEVVTGLVDNDHVRFVLTPYTENNLGGTAGTSVQRIVSLTPPGESNEPEGFTVFLHNEGDTKDFGTGWGPTTAWSGEGDDYNDDFVEVVADENNPTGSGFAIQKNYWGATETGTVGAGATTTVIPITGLARTGRKTYDNRLITINGETSAVVTGSWVNGTIQLATALSSAPAQGTSVSVSGDRLDGKGSKGQINCSRWTNLPHGFVAKRQYVRMLLQHSSNWDLQMTNPTRRPVKLGYWGLARINPGGGPPNQFTPIALRAKSGDGQDPPYRSYLIINGISGLSGTFDPWSANRASSPGEIIKLEWLYEAQSAKGVADGTYRHWVDGVLEQEYTNFRYAAIDDPKFELGFDGCEIYFIRGIPSSDYFAIDDWLRIHELHISAEPF
jgi:hypothetical protein